MRKTLQFLGFLNDGDIEWLMSAGEVAVLPAGRTAVRAGDTVDRVSIVVSGRLALSDADGGGVSHYLGPGDVLGEISARPAQYTVTADVPSRVLHVRRADFVRRCEADEGFAARFDDVLASLVSRRMLSVLREDDASAALCGSETDSVELDAETLDRIALAARKFDFIRGS